VEIVASASSTTRAAVIFPSLTARAMSEAEAQVGSMIRPPTLILLDNPPDVALVWRPVVTRCCSVDRDKPQWWGAAMSVRKRSWKTPTGESREAWVVDYSDQLGHRHLKTMVRKKDADTYHAQVAVDVREGHASIQMTADTYGHLFPHQHNAAELVAADHAFMAVPT
jgi:hypothetical protein